MLIDLVLYIYSFETEIGDLQNSHKIIMIRDVFRIQIHQTVQSGVTEEVQRVCFFEKALHETL